MSTRAFGSDVSNVRLGQKERVIKKVFQETSQPKNPMSEYLPKIKEFWLSNVHQAEADYFDSQIYLTEKMRSVLVDWMVDVCKKYKLKEETLFLAVNILDRYMEKELVSREQLQLIGVTCIMIASKYEEIYPQDAQEFASVTADTYTRQQVIQAEVQILSKLKFRITTTSPFKLFYKNNTSYPKEFERFVIYLLEISLQEVNYLKYKPQELLSACIILSIKACPNLQVNGIEEIEETQKISQLTKEILQLAQRQSPYYATKRKFAAESIQFLMLNESDE